MATHIVKEEVDIRRRVRCTDVLTVLQTTETLAALFL